MKNDKIGEINEARSITKISKELANVTSRMKELADEFYGGELGSAKRVKEIKNELRELTPKKKTLIQELDDSVAGKDRNIELAIEESLLSDEELLENHLNEKITVKQALRNASDALLETPQGKKFDTEYIYDYLESLERMAKKDPKSFVKDYGDFTINDYIEDVEYNMANESKDLNEGEFVIIDTRGNARDIGSKIQGQRFLKGKKGFHIVLKKNALKARRAIEKNGGKTTGSKISDILYDMMYEGTSIVEGYKSNIKKKWASTDTMMDDLREFILDAKDSGGEDLVRDIHSALRLMTNYAEGELKESVLNKETAVVEARNIQTKRKYTDNHPAKTVGTSARIRNKILEAIKDGKMNQTEFDRIVKELSSDHKRWMKRNSKMFNVSEEGISLTKFGHTILKGITVNESFESFRNNK